MKTTKKYLMLALCATFTAFSPANVPFRQEDQDKIFVQKAAEGGLLEVKLGQLAIEKGSSPAVKDFGKRMVADHTKVNDELMSLAKKKSLEVPASLSKMKQQNYDSLAAQTGEKFDMLYMNMMIASHEETIGLFHTESSAGKDPELKTWAESKVPALKHHLEMAEALFHKAGKK